MKNRHIFLWLMIYLLATVLPASRAVASGFEPISQSDLSISAGTEISEAVTEEESEADGNKYDYSPDWTITISDFDIALHISEEDYSILSYGETEKYVRSLDRLGMTAERATEILETNRAIMEIFPSTAGEFTDYIIFIQDYGEYEEAEGKNLAQLIEEGSPVVDRFRNRCRETLYSEDRCLNRTCEEEVAIGPFLFDVYTFSLDNGGIYTDYATVHNGSMLVIDGACWDSQYVETVKTAMDNIVQNTSDIIQGAPPLQAFDPEGLKQSLLDQNALQLADMTGMASLGIIRYFPFGTAKEEIRTALKEHHTVHEDNGSGSNEFYVFYKTGVFDEQWQCFYEFDQEDKLISVTMVFISEGTSDVFTNEFLNTLNYFTERTGDYETDQQDAIDLLKEDSDAFMDQLDAGKVSIMTKWADAFGGEGEDLYLNFKKIQGNPAVFLTFFANGYQH